MIGTHCTFELEQCCSPS